MIVVHSENKLQQDAIAYKKYKSAGDKLGLFRFCKVKKKAMIRNWYNQIPHPALKTKREITKYINWQQCTKGTRGKQNEQLFPK